MSSQELCVVNKKGARLFVDLLYVGCTAPNVIFCCTPIVSVTDFRACYEPLAASGFNVFALDFAGVGKSQGTMRDFSVSGVAGDLDALVGYIREHYGCKVFLFGDTGTGGVFAQHYVASSNAVDAFAQFGCCIAGDVSPLGFPKALLSAGWRLLLAVGAFFPELRVPFSEPPYDGFNAEKDNGFYERLRKEHPEMFRAHVRFLTALLGMFLGKNGAAETAIRVPTLVFKTLHDRYFPVDYFDRYYGNLRCPKKLVEIDDVHNSYFFSADRIARDVADWFAGRA